MRIDPALGALAPALAAPSYMATQVEILQERAGRVAGREAARRRAIAGGGGAVARGDQGQDPARALLRRRAAEGPVGRAVAVAATSSTSPSRRADPIFAQAAANAFAQAYMDVSVDLRVAPARQSATFLDEQTKALRANLEQAQTRLSKFQQNKGIVVSDERLDQENARYNALMAQLAMAQAEQVETDTRQRNTGTETSPDVLQSGAVQGLKSQLAAAQTKLTEISEHRRQEPSDPRAARGADRRAAPADRRRDPPRGRRHLDRQPQQRRRRSTSCRRSSTRRRSSCSRCVPIATRSPCTCATSRPRSARTTRSRTRLGQLNLEGQNNQANTRLLSPAVEPLEPSRPKIIVGIVGSILGGLVAGLLAAIGWRLLNRRVRKPEDLMVVPGVPVIGVLRPANSKQPVFRRLLMLGGGPAPRPPLLAGPGARVVKTIVSMLGSPPRATRTLGAILIDSGQLTPGGRRARPALPEGAQPALRRGGGPARPHHRGRHPVRAVAPVRVRLSAQGARRGAHGQRRAGRGLPAVQPARRAAARHSQPAHAALVRQGRGAPGADGRRRRARRRPHATWLPTWRSSSRSSASARCWSTPTCASRASTSCSRSRTRSASRRCSPVARARRRSCASPTSAGLSVLPAGPTPPNPLELLNRLNFDEFMIGVRGAYDVVIVDTPAMSVGEDAAMIAVKHRRGARGRAQRRDARGRLHRPGAGPHGRRRRGRRLGAERGAAAEKKAK